MKKTLERQKTLLFIVKCRLPQSTLEFFKSKLRENSLSVVRTDDMRQMLEDIK